MEESRPKLLIVDDNDEVRRQLKWGLAKSGFELIFAQNGVEAMDRFTKLDPDVVTLDLGLPPDPNGTSEGLRCLREMLRIDPLARVVVITGNEDHAAALEAVQSGASDYYKKPVVLDELKVIIDRAMRLRSLELESRKLHDSPAAEGGIIGECQAMQTVYSQISKVAVSDFPVLITGESGTGKELVAKSIHAQSPRSDREMVCINCGAIPENLLESELFGHEKGAFTGASRTVQGKVEYADKGTLFLDEIGEMPINLQVKLLRFLQEMVIQRVGGRQDIKVDVRIIAATNIDIDEAMEKGTFREDLFYRIGVVNIMLPPLRDRGGDIELLANHFLAEVNAQTQSGVHSFSEEAMQLIKGYEWPGNIRELENRVKRAVIMASGTEVTPEDLGMGGEKRLHSPSAPDPVEMEDSLRDARARLEKRMVEDALARSGGNVLKAAEAIGVSRPTFYDLMKKHGVSSD